MKANDSRKYFTQLAHNTPYFEELKNAVTQSSKKVTQSILQGKVPFSKEKQNINDKINDYEANIKNKKMSLQVELLNLQRQLQYNSQEYKAMKKQLFENKKKEQEEQKAQQERHRKQVAEKAKKWHQDQKTLQIKKKLHEQKRLEKQKQQEQKRKKNDEDEKNFFFLHRKKQIEKKIKQIEQQRQKREEILKNSIIVLSKSVPKYLEIEKKYNQQEYEKQFEESIQKKNRKLNRKLDHQALKQHEKAYLQKVKERAKSFDKQDNQDDIANREQFNLISNRDPQAAKSELIKLNRRRKFQEKISAIPINIDQSKKVQIQINIDKGKNRLKYNFLSQKALNEFQIYGQFGQFALNSNSRQLGNQYLKELRNLPKQSRIVKSNSTQIMNASAQQKPTYKNYLQDFKRKRGPQTEDQFDKIVKNKRNKQQAKQQLRQRSISYQSQAKRKMHELKGIGNIKLVIKKQKQINDTYLKAVNAKLKALQIQ